MSAKIISVHESSTFNFAVDVVDVWANKKLGDALITVDAMGNENRYSFSDISRLSKKLAFLLNQNGVKQGDRIVVMLPRIAAWQISMIAVLRLGAVPVPCITMLTASDIEYRVNHSGAIGIITSVENTVKVDQLDEISVKVSVGGDTPGWSSFDTIESLSEYEVSAQVNVTDPAIIYYTSGSTGKPKGVTHSSGALRAWSISAVHWLDLSADDVMWCTADTGWSKAGTSILFGPWSQGSAVLFYDGSFDVGHRFELLEKYKVTVFCASATELRRLILHDTSGFNLKHLRNTVSAGESVNPEIINQWKRISGTQVSDGYGQTETLMTITNRLGMPIKPGSMGKPLPGIMASVLTGDSQEPQASGLGELLIGQPNPQIMLGYWKDDARTKKSKYKSGDIDWFMTGDNVLIDEEGYIFYQGRADDIINSSGYRIGPQEVENVLSEHDAIQECAVTGAKDPGRGEVVKAWVILKSGFTSSNELTKDIQDFVKSKTAPYKYPRQVEYVDKLPKTVTGKIKRSELRESICAKGV